MSKAFRTREERGDAFIDAAGLGHIVEVQRLIAEGEVDVNAHDNSDESNTALILASQNGRPMVVNALIAAGADVNAANKNGDTPLILASLNGHAQIVDALLRARANVHATDQFGSCALFYASRQGHCGLVDALVDAGADVNHSRVTALLIASRFGHASAVAKLLAAGADVECVDDDGNTALHRCALETTPGAVYGGRIGEVAELLVEACIDTEAKNDEGKRAWDLARRGMECGTSEWQKVRCRELAEVLEDAREMTVGLRRWLADAGLATQWREFARIGAKERDDIDMIERDDLTRDRGSLLAPIQANRFFRARDGPATGDAPRGRVRGHGRAARAVPRRAQARRVRVPVRLARGGVRARPPGRDGGAAGPDGGAHGLKILDRRRFDKAARALRRRLLEDAGEDQASAERHAPGWREKLESETGRGAREETERGERRTRGTPTRRSRRRRKTRAQKVRPDRPTAATKNDPPRDDADENIHVVRYTHSTATWRDARRPARDDALHPRRVGSPRVVD
jgi:hypothetical protein